MWETILAACITGVLSLIGVLIANRKNADAIDHKLDKAQAVTETKLDELTREVREHNNFARRMPVLEEQLRMASRRIGNLENKHHEADR